jgi:tRNA (guanine-N7-)-methyltransferase
MPAAPGSGSPWRNFYGRRRGKALRKGQAQHMADDLPRIAVPGVAREENPGRTPIDPAAAYGRAAPLWLDIGFGHGEHLLSLAAAFPEVNLIGAEAFRNGVAVLVARLAEEPRPNVRVHPGDVRDLLEVLPDGSLDRAYLLYPDPWPKARHHKRRFVSPDYLRPLARVMCPGAELRLATDIPDYMRQALEELVPEAGFRPAARPGPDPWKGWTGTRYEAKALRDGRAPIYATFIRS